MPSIKQGDWDTKQDEDLERRLKQQDDKDQKPRGEPEEPKQEHPDEQHEAG